MAGGRGALTSRRPRPPGRCTTLRRELILRARRQAREHVRRCREAEVPNFGFGSLAVFSPRAPRGRRPGPLCGRQVKSACDPSKSSRTSVRGCSSFDVEPSFAVCPFIDHGVEPLDGPCPLGLVVLEIVALSGSGASVAAGGAKLLWRSNGRVQAIGIRLDLLCDSRADTTKAQRGGAFGAQWGRRNKCDQEESEGAGRARARHEAKL